MEKKTYECLNHEAKAYFEYILKRDINNDNYFVKELNDLCDKGILFILKVLYDFKNTYYTDILIRDYKGQLKDYKELFEKYLNIGIDSGNIQNINSSSLVIELVDSHPFILLDFINREYNGGFSTISVSENEKDSIYMLLPESRDIDRVGLRDLYVNIDLHFNNYSHLEFSKMSRDKWEILFDKFITIEIMESSK